MIILEFFKSSSWRGIQTRVFTTLGLSSVGTMANALPQEVTPEQAEQLMKLDMLTKYLAVGSYILSVAVALTVLVRFIVWLCDRYQNNKHKYNGSNNNNS